MANGTGNPRALITGASSGIGLALSKRLAGRGIEVWLAARRMELLEKLVAEIIANGGNAAGISNPQMISQLYRDIELPTAEHAQPAITIHNPASANQHNQHDTHDFSITHHSEEVEESLSLYEKESDLIRKALKKHRGKRKLAAQELGISERTLYRKIKELDLN